MTASTSLTAMSAAPAIYKGHPLWGMLREFQSGPLEFLSRMAELGPAVSTRAGPQRVIVAISPEAVEHVLVRGARHYDKHTRGYRMLKLALGDGLVTSEGATWRRHRRLAQPAFHKTRLQAWGSMIVDRTEALVRSWCAQAGPEVGSGQDPRQAPASGAVDMHNEMMALTLGVVTEALFSSNLARHSATIAASLAVALKYIEEATRSLAAWPLWVPTRDNRQFRRAIGALDQIVLDLISERRAHGAGRASDLLDVLLYAADSEDGSRLDDREVRDEIMTLITAGHETTANALTWTLHLLSLHPEQQEQARREVDDQLGSRPATADDLARLPLVDRILKESMRLYPPVWAFERAALAVDTIAGHAVRPGDLVLIAPWATHRCAHFWANPDHFDPDRFLPEAESERQKFAYFPFSAGARKCIGDGFAMLEARLILATLLQNCRLVRADKNPLIPEPLVTLRPRGALNMHVTLRPSETSDEAKARNSELAQPSR